jgi:HSP20 family protein
LRVQSVPAVNIRETDKDFEISLAAPGLSRKDFDVSVDDNRVLTISSEKKEEKETKEKNYTRQEFSYSSFSRSFALPENVKEDDVNAKYEDGVLKVTLMKKAIPAQKAKKAIEVH